MKTFNYSAALASAIALTAGMADAEVTLSILIDNNPETISSMEAVTAAYAAANPGVTFDIEQRAGGADGDNIVKTRLATGEMADIFNYNSGSLFQALRPQDTLADLTGLAGQANVQESFKTVVTAPDGTIRGIPFGPAMGGGIFYNRKIYADLGLAIPKSWDEFMANNAKIAEAGKVPVITTFGDTWTSQIFILADYFNVQLENPTFAADYTANKAKYATTPGAARGFDYLEAVFKANYMNEDFGVAKFEDGLRMVATGEGAHYPMLTFGIGTVKQNNPDSLPDLGFFAQPGIDPAKNGLTVWMPAALYMPKDGPNAEEAAKFLDFVASVEGCNAMIAGSGASGPYLIKGCELPADVPQAVADMLPYFQTEGMTSPALEFMSPLKGPALEQIAVEVGSGIRPAAEAAALYDQDVEKQAKQLGLPNW